MKNFYTSTVFLVIFFISSVNLLANNEPNKQNKNLRFQENKGQVSDQFYKPRPDVLFAGCAGDLVFHLKQNGLSYQMIKINTWKKNESFIATIRNLKSSLDEEPDLLSVYRIDIDWIGCNSNAAIEKGIAFDDYDNYYSEACPVGALKVKSYQSILYKNLYPGIDLKWYEHQNQLKYDYLVEPGSNYKAIKWRIKGATSIHVNQVGQLIIQTPIGELMEEKPIVFQEGQTLYANWKIHGDEISFEIEGINQNKPFTIDPLIKLWATYYGGNLSDQSFYSCVDIAANVFISGLTRSASTTNIATVGSHQTLFGGAGSGQFKGDAFIAKFNAQGIRQWGTYFGGNGSDFANTCITDANGDVYFVGGTTSTASNVIATPAAFQSTLAGGPGIGDALIVKLNSNGARLWSTYYGDISEDWAIGACVDLSGNLYITGGTWSNTNSAVFSTSGAHQLNHASGLMNVDAYATKFSPTGARIWSTYYGTSEHDNGISCAIDLLGNFYVVAETSSTLSSVMVTSGAHQTSHGGGTSAYSDAVLIKFNSLGNRLWATYYGGADNDYPLSVKVDKFNSVYMCGVTSSTLSNVISTSNAFQPNFGGGTQDAFLVKFNQNGQRLFGTYYGGSGSEDGACFVDSYNQVYIAGNTSSSNGTSIATPCAYQSIYGGGSSDAYIAKFDSTGNRLWGTYYGGTGNEISGEPSADINSNVYLQGFVNSATNTLVIASSGAHQTNFAGGVDDAFLVKFDNCRPTPPPAITNTNACKGQSSVFISHQSCGLQWYSDSLLNNLVFTGGSFTTNIFNQDTTFWMRDISCGMPSALGKIKIVTIPSPTIQISASKNTLCYGETLTLTASGALTYTWATINSMQPTVVLTATNSMVHGVNATAANGCGGSNTFNLVVDACLNLNDKQVVNEFFFQVFPNPNNGSFYINHPSLNHLSIINDLGQLIIDLDLSNSIENKMMIDGLKNGVYFIIANNETSIYKQKILVQ